jgi:hypothetical protein
MRAPGIPDQLAGGAFNPFSAITNVVKEGYERARAALSGPRKEAPPSVRKFLEEHQDDIITALYVCRVPIVKAIDTVLNIISFGKFASAKKKYGYDELFHLYLLVTLNTRQGPKSYLIERNQVFRITEAKPGDYGADKCMTVRTLRGGMKFGPLIENAAKSEPDGQFWLYDPLRHNCQDALISILQHSNLLTPELSAFVKQDAKELLSGDVSKIARAITDIAAVGDIFIHGKGLERQMAMRRLKKIHGAGVARLIPRTLSAYGFK